MSTEATTERCRHTQDMFDAQEKIAQLEEQVRSLLAERVMLNNRIKQLETQDAQP